MKIVITSQGREIDSEIDQRFGRCKYFVIVETENNEITNVSSVENQGAIQGHGAGIRAGQQVGELGAEAIITGSLGPNASKVIDKLSIAAYKSSGLIKDSIEKLNNNKLTKLNEIGEPHGKLTEENNNDESKPETHGERIYFPLLNNNGLDSEISYHFGHAPFFGLYDVKTKEFTVIENTLDHVDPNKSPIDQIIEAVNPTTIFAHGIGGRAVNIIKEKGLNLKTGNFKTVQEVVDNLDKLEDQDSDCGHEH